MKSNVFVKTKRKIVRTSITIVLIALFLFASIALIFYRMNLYSFVDQKLAMDMNVLMKNAQNSDTESVPGQFPHGQFTPPSISNPQTIMLIYSNTELVYESENRYFTGEDPQVSITEEQRVSIYVKNGYTFRYIAFSINEMQYVLMINVDSENASFLRLCNIAAFSMAILTGISYFLSVFLARRALDPVIKSYEQQVLFVQNASHEMRTPLSVIKGKMELLAVNSEESIEQNAELLSDMMSELCGLEKLNSDLLLLSKESVDVSIDRSKFFLSDLIADLSDYYSSLAQTQEKIFTVTCNADILMCEDYAKIKRSIVILLENAFRYTLEGDAVGLEFLLKEKYLQISVSDSGIGIKKEDQPKIFDRFFRSDDVRGLNIEGSGIGLSILLSLSRTLNFRIGMHSEQGKGTRFDLMYPLK